MTYSDIKLIDCKQCIALLNEVGKLERCKKILRLKIKQQYEQIQYFEQQILELNNK